MILNSKLLNSKLLNSKFSKININYDVIFQVIVYIVSIYLITIENSISVNICGWIILISHIYKDLTNLSEWPEWCECIGLLLAILLINGGININNYFILFIGIMKFFAHIRQCIFNDNCYYY